MTVTNAIWPLEVNGKERTIKDTRQLVVESHWNWSDRVHLKFGDLNILVPANELQKAIENATNK